MALQGECSARVIVVARAAFLQNRRMTDPIDAFVLSLERDAPPPLAAPLLRAVWHGLRGQWDAAHEIAQAQDDAQGAWVHAWLHRIEGDLGNADYWYRVRAGRRAATTRATRDRDRPRADRSM
jgi:hypothetical protein